MAHMAITAGLVKLAERIGAGGVMTHQAIGVLLSGKIEPVTLPARAYMTVAAAGFVRGHGDKEIVDHTACAELLSGGGVVVLQRPVLGFMYLVRSRIVAFQADLDDITSFAEFSVQTLEPVVIGGGLCRSRFVRIRHRAEHIPARFGLHCFRIGCPTVC